MVWLVSRYLNVYSCGSQMSTQCTQPSISTFEWVNFRSENMWVNIRSINGDKIRDIIRGWTFLLMFWVEGLNSPNIGMVWCGGEDWIIMFFFLWSSLNSASSAYTLRWFLRLLPCLEITKYEKIYKIGKNALKFHFISIFFKLLQKTCKS